MTWDALAAITDIPLTGAIAGFVGFLAAVGTMMIKFLAQVQKQNTSQITDLERERDWYRDRYFESTGQSGFRDGVRHDPDAGLPDDANRPRRGGPAHGA